MRLGSTWPERKWSCNFWFFFLPLKITPKPQKTSKQTKHPPNQPTNKKQLTHPSKKTPTHFTRTKICKFVYYSTSGTTWPQGAGHSCAAQDPECKHSPAIVLTFQELWHHRHLSFYPTATVVCKPGASCQGHTASPGWCWNLGMQGYGPTHRPPKGSPGKLTWALALSWIPCIPHSDPSVCSQHLKWGSLFP